MQFDHSNIGPAFYGSGFFDVSAKWSDVLGAIKFTEKMAFNIVLS